jgi:hypothetical protein
MLILQTLLPNCNCISFLIKATILYPGGIRSHVP